jgi:DNA-binding CsgD family transcriptional regulator
LQAISLNKAHKERATGSLDGALAADATALPGAELRSCLPWRFRDLTHRMSVPGLIGLIETMGGTRVYIRKAPATTSKLAALLSREDFAALRDEVAGEEIAIPRAADLRRRLRNRQVVALLASGVSTSAVARRFAMSERNVWWIASAHRRNIRQGLESERRQRHRGSSSKMEGR